MTERKTRATTTAKADSFAALRNDNKKARNDNKEARNDSKKSSSNYSGHITVIRELG
ncbi:MAG: hypothetical protein ABI147_03115 [Acidobacteriaceae bacterium]